MTRSDRIFLGVLVFCAAAGLLQHQLTRPRKERPAPEILEKQAAGGSASNKAKWISGDMAPYAAPLPAQRQRKFKPCENPTVSIEERRSDAIREMLAEKTPNISPPSADFDKYAARQTMKEILFSEEFDRKNSTPLTDKEKWDIIKAGLLPW